MEGELINRSLPFLLHNLSRIHISNFHLPIYLCIKYFLLPQILFQYLFIYLLHDLFLYQYQLYVAAGWAESPAHSTIACFRIGFLADACRNLFYQMVRRLEDAGELSKETVFIDGAKLKVCVNKYTFVLKKSVGKWVEKMFQKIQESIQLLNR